MIKKLNRIELYVMADLYMVISYKNSLSASLMCIIDVQKGTIFHSLKNECYQKCCRG